MVKRGVWFVFALIIVLMISFAFSNISVAKDSGMKVSSEVSKAIQENGKARVIVVMKDSPSEFGKFSISASDSRKQAIAGIGKEKIGYEFQSFNGFSASLTAEDIAKLETDDRVERIEYDIPVQISLQDSVPLINASLAWQVNQSGINITGAGETICIIDTGINYTHPDLGGCQIRNLSLNGTIFDNVTQSEHPYPSNTTSTWNISFPGFSKIAVHFSYIATEPGFDYVYVYDNNSNPIMSYTGEHSDLWSPSIDGNLIVIQMVSDVGIEHNGFYIDQIINGTTNTTYNWSSCSKVPFGTDIVNNDSDPYDDHGHGTHVAGIAAANGAIKGVAPDAKIVAVKVMNSSGEGYSSDIIAGMDWCTNNSALYNISVISMSLGGGLYTSYCDAELTSYRDVINAAVGKNISVIVATGNTDPLGYIRAPACIRNATAVGGTTKADAMMYNRNNITDLLAPGFLIYSTIPSGYYSYSGTSMATPHAAGAFALVRQFYKLKTGNIMKPAEIENVLNDTGKRISDTGGNGLNFSRINVYSALQELDKPVITVSSPQSTYYKTKSVLIDISSSAQQTIWWSNGTANITYSTPGYYNFTEGNNTIYVYANGTLGGTNSTMIILDVDTINPNINFTNPTTPEGNYSRRAIWANVTANDSYLDKIVINLYNSSWTNSTQSSATGFFVNFTSLADGIYYLNASANDTAGNTNWTEARKIKLDNTPPFFASIWPANNTWNNGILSVVLNEPGFCWLVFNGTNYTMTTDSSMTQFSYTNSTESSNKTLNATFYCNDTMGYLNSSNPIFFGIDRTPPTIGLISPENGISTTNSSMLFNYNASDTNQILKNCSIIFDGSILSTDTSVVSGGTDEFVSSGYSAASHTWSISCIDEAGNTGTSGSRTFTKTGTSSSNDGSSTSTDNGDSGGADTEYEGTIYNVTGSSITNGTSKRLRESDKLVFKINGTEHSLTVLDINFTSNITSIKIRSTIITADLKAGEEKKFDVTEDNYLDLYVKLNDVRYPRANLTIKEIYEKSIINITTNITKGNETESNWSIKNTFSKIGSGISKGWSASWSFIKDKKWWFIGGLIVAVLAGMVVAIKIYMRRKGYRLNLGALFVKEKEGNVDG
jgi:subtilisin family serine protease